MTSRDFHAGNWRDSQSYMERGCVEDQPQRLGSSKASRACSVLRLVEDDTAALRSNSGEGRVRAMLIPPRQDLCAYCKIPFPANNAMKSLFFRSGSVFEVALTATLNWPPHFFHDNVAKAANIWWKSQCVNY